MPFLLGGVIRLIVSSGGLSWTAFSAAELAICIALLSLFINQNLLRSERLLDNEDIKKDAEMNALALLIVVLIYIVLFAVIITCKVTLDFHSVEMLKGPLLCFQLIVFLLTPFILLWTISLQQSFRLGANI